MARIRSGEQDVLLVVDVQNGVVADAWDRDRVVGNVATAVERARAAGVPVVWVQHSDEDLPLGSETWQIVEDLRPGEGEPIVRKTHHSSFEATELEDVLAELGATRIAVAGAQSNWCIRATSYAALERGYDLTLVRDAHTTDDIEFSDGEIVTAKSIVRDLNLTMSGISFDGRSARTTTAAELYG